MVFLSLSICCAMTEEFEECAATLKRSESLKESIEDEIRIKFCWALLSEKQCEYQCALEGYSNCLTELTQLYDFSLHSVDNGTEDPQKTIMNDIRGDVLLRTAIVRKDMGQLDDAMELCVRLDTGAFGVVVHANALCLKGLLHEMRAEFPSSEVVYRSALQLMPGHGTALERLGRVYLRYRETIPAAVQCFFKSVETNPSNHVAWYLLGRCYMATEQYTDACEAYNRAINLNPNDPQVWCSLGVLYYAFGQYKESLGMLARALKLEPSMADAWYNVGALYDMVDQPDDAQLAYMKARENGLADRFARAGMGANPLATIQPGTASTAGASNASVQRYVPTQHSR
jgi:TPR repeat